MKLLLTILLLLLSSPSFTQKLNPSDIPLEGGTRGVWSSIKYKTSLPASQLKDDKGKLMTVVYLENLACEKIGQNSNAEDVAWLLSQGYAVVELDYAHDPKAMSPYINMDIIRINSELNKGTFCGISNISPHRAYVLFEGYRLQRDVAYCQDDPTVYNYPEAYAKTQGDSLYMDIAYPANPSRPVPTMLTFSYSNSYYGNPHARMFLGYTWAMFSDTFLLGCPAVGVAWAVADHPKYCDWGRGNRPGGAQKEYGAIEVNPDAISKVHSAISTLRTVGTTLNLSDDIMLYGFSRGSTAASLALTPYHFNISPSSKEGAGGRSGLDVQGLFLGPGVFDYALMPATSNEYKHMETYVNYAVSQGIFANKDEAWQAQRTPYLTSPNNSPSYKEGAGGRSGGASPCPVFLFYNTDDDPNYHTQMQNLISALDSSGATYELLKDYGTGHSVPQTTDHLAQMYRFLQDHCLTTTPSNISSPSYKEGGGGRSGAGGRSESALRMTPDGRPSATNDPRALYVSNGKKYLLSSSFVTENNASR